jgi:hypothetical protein
MTDRLDRRIREIVVEVAESSPAPPDFRDVVGADRLGAVNARRPRRHKARTRAAVALVALASLAAAGLLVWARAGSDHRVGVTTHEGAGRPGWRELPAGPLEPRVNEASVWTGRQLIVWGGASPSEPKGFADGAAYDTRTARWHRIARSPLQGRIYAAAVWTGKEMIIWGGGSPVGGALFDDGAAYNPKTNRWRRISPWPGNGRVRAIAFWNGDDMIIWGGSNPSALPGGPQDPRIANGAAYNPRADSWRSIATPSFFAGYPAFGVWTGEQLMVWGTLGATLGAATYTPLTNEWRELPPSPVTPLGSAEPVVWTGAELIVPGAQLKQVGAESGATDGAAYNQQQDTWRPIAPAPPLLSCSEPISQWTGRVVLSFCGANTRAPTPLPAILAAYNPSSDHWQTLDPPPAPIEGAAGAWTGRELILWGVTYGANRSTHAAAAAYRPSTRRLGRSETGRSAAPACGSELPRPLAIPQGHNGPHARGISDAPTPPSATQLVQSWTATTGDIEVRWPADPPLAASFPPQDPPAPSPAAVGAVTPNSLEQAPSGRFFNYIVFSLRDQQPDCQTLQVSVFDTDGATVVAAINEMRQTPFASSLPLIAGSRTVDAAPGVVACRTPPGVSSPNRGGPITGAGSHPTPAAALQGFVESDPTLPRNSYQELQLPDGSIAYAWQNPAGDWVIVIHVTPTSGTWTVDNWNASGC